MKRAVPLLLAATLASLLAGCGESGDRYVAIGDSYTAAPYVGRLDGADGCFRSRDNYPHLLADELDFDLKDVSCSAATSEAVAGKQKTPQGAQLPPQLDAIDKNTKLVTVRIGANDFDLIGRVIVGCVQVATTTPTGSPCSDIDAAAGANTSTARFPEVQERLAGVFGAIRERAPKARIVALGYPQIFPTAEQGGCSDLPIPDGDVGWAYGINVGIDDAIKRAAITAGVDFIDVFPKTKEHHICSDDPWMAGAKLEKGRKGLVFHPYAEEATLEADLLKDLLS